MTELREIVARALCKRGGFDPDEIMPNDGPRWRYYEDGADAAIAAMWPVMREMCAVVAERIAFHDRQARYDMKANSVPAAAILSMHIGGETSAKKCAAAIRNLEPPK